MESSTPLSNDKNKWNNATGMIDAGTKIESLKKKECVAFESKNLSKCQSKRAFHYEDVMSSSSILLKRWFDRRKNGALEPLWLSKEFVTLEL